jgi:hypothetical protein
MTQLTRTDYCNQYSKIQLEELLKTNSQSKVGRMLGCSRETVKYMMDYYGIAGTYFKNENITGEYIVKQLNDRQSMVQIVHKCGCNIATLNDKLCTVKDFVKPKILFTKTELFESLQLCDISNQGFTKVVSLGDSNLKDSIVELTKDHKLNSNKITERIYRLAHGYDAKYEAVCSICSDKLKFYTYTLGYGNSEHEICRRCVPSVSVPSRIASTLFDAIYEYYDKNIDCFYFPHNYEYTISVDESVKSTIEPDKITGQSMQFVAYDECGTFEHPDFDNLDTGDKILQKIKDNIAELPEETDYTDYVKDKLNHLQEYWQNYPKPLAGIHLEVNHADEYGRRYRHIR